MTDAELDALQAKLARQITIKMCLQANDAIESLREQVAAKDVEIAKLQKERAGTVEYGMQQWERAERAEADSVALREATALNHADPMAVACSAALRRAEKAEADNAALHGLLIEWEDGMYDGQDFLRRVRLAIHGDKGLIDAATKDKP